MHREDLGLGKRMRQQLYTTQARYVVQSMWIQTRFWDFRWYPNGIFFILERNKRALLYHYTSKYVVSRLVGLHAML